MEIKRNSQEVVSVSPGEQPIAYPSAMAAGKSPLLESGSGAETYQCEIMGTKQFQKVGLVEEVSTGRTWRLAADEGTYLKGTNQAPAPLMHWGAGVHADVTSRISEIARDRTVELTWLSVKVRQGFASKGSFARGEAVAVVFDLKWEIEINGRCEDNVLEKIVDAALASSVTVAALTSSIEGAFALHTNGRATPVDGVIALEGSAAKDPLRKYSRAPVPTGEVIAKDVLVSQPFAGSGGIVLSNDNPGAIGWHVDVSGGLDTATGLIRTSVGFPEVTQDRWSLLCDPAGIVAPSPLAYFAIGTAFCFHTQLCRYIDVRRLSIENARLTQTSRFYREGSKDSPVPGADPFETHVFFNGRCTEAETRSLLTVAANTCYAHRALAVEVRADARMSTNDDRVPAS